MSSILWVLPSPKVCLNDEGIIVRVVLEPKVGFGEGNWDVRPGGTEMIAFKEMQDCAEVFFPLTFRLMH